MGKDRKESQEDPPFEVLIETTADQALKTGRARMPLDFKRINIPSYPCWPDYYNADILRLTQGQERSGYFHRCLVQAVATYLDRSPKYSPEIVLEELESHDPRKGSRLEGLIFHRRGHVRIPKMYRDYYKDEGIGGVWTFRTKVDREKDRSYL